MNDISYYRGGEGRGDKKVTKKEDRKATRIQGKDLEESANRELMRHVEARQSSTAERPRLSSCSGVRLWRGGML